MSRLLEKAYTVIALLFMSMAIVPLFRPRGWILEDAMASDPILFAVQLFVYLVLFFFVFKRFHRIAQAAVDCKLLWALVALALCSAAWSGVPDYTLRRALVLCATTAFGFYFGVRYSLRDQLRILATTAAIALILSAFVAIAFPSHGTQAEYGGAWCGVFSHKNIFGRFIVLSAIVFFVRYQRKPDRRILWLLACAALVLLSRSATSIVVACTIPLAVLLVRVVRLRLRTAIPVLIGLTTAAVVAVFTLADNFSLILLQLGRDSTLTGRTQLWQVVSLAISRRVWLGYGFNSFWLGMGGDSAAVLTSVRWAVRQAHNGFLDLWLELGVVGLVLFCCLFFVSTKHAIAYARDDSSAEGAWPLLYLWFMLLANLTESGILRQNNLFWALFVAVSASLSIQYRRARLAPEPLTADAAA